MSEPGAHREPAAGDHETSPVTFAGTSTATHDGRQRAGRWRAGTPLVLAACGALLVASALSSQGTDLRPERFTDLASLVEDEAQQAEALQARAAALADEVDSLTAAVPDSRAANFRRAAQAYRQPAGLRPESGAGVVVTMADAPREVQLNSDEDANRHVVHQQDLQAVVNALWAGGAEALTIQGQRVITTTGIKCEGSQVQLQGIPYPQPYVVRAIGDADALAESLGEDIDVSGYRADAEDPDIAVGWDLAFDPDIAAPAYEGVRDITFAEPIPEG